MLPRSRGLLFYQTLVGANSLNSNHTQMPRELALILVPDALSAEAVDELLAPIGFVDPRTALARLRSITPDDESRRLLGGCLPMLLQALSDAATPDNSVLNFERFVQSVRDRRRLLQFLADNPRAVEILVKLFVGSQFLTEILLRNPESLRELTEHKRLAEFKAREEFLEGAVEAMQPHVGSAQKFDALRRFQKWELLRIGACDSFGLLDFKSVVLQLSLLADSMAQAALGVIASELGIATDDFCVLAFGKLGGEELNYSSDIDLVFISRGDAARYWNLSQRLIRALGDATAEGFLYRVDMRLRPWGRSGALVCTVDAYVEYLHQHAALWEKQALLKARPIAGNLRLGVDFLKTIDPNIYGVPIDASRENIRAMKSKIEAELTKKGRIFGDVKSGRGSIRDIEFVTQFLQIKHGRDQKSVRSRGTLDGLIRLADFDLILPGEYRRLTSAYVLFRTIEHSLQLMHYKQEHSLPQDDRELSYLARRLDFPSGSAFLDAYTQHRADVRRIYERYIEIGQPELPADPSETTDATRLPRHADVMERSYQKVFTTEEIQQHGRLLDKLTRDHPIEIETTTAPGERVQLTVCGFDQKGNLALMCGLLFVYGYDIVHGNVFTAEQVDESLRDSNLKSRTEPSSNRSTARAGQNSPRKFVNAFTLKPPANVKPTADVWSRYKRDLTDLMKLCANGKLREAQGTLASRVAGAFRDMTANDTKLLPIDIDISNDVSTRYTVLHISADDTPGFLYELANALSLFGFDIQRVIVGSLGNRVVDTLFISGPHGGKITDEGEQARLRASIVLIKHFIHLLPQSPNPEHALSHFGQLAERLFSQPQWISDLASLDRSEVLEALAQLLGVSDFLWDDFLRLQHDNLFPVVRDVERLNERKTQEQLRSELSAELAAATDRADQQRRLNAFKDREMFRVDMRHIVGKIHEFDDFSFELTDIAEVIVGGTYELCLAEMLARFNRPMVETPEGLREATMSVLALGKAGGRELGFASDIELMFVYGPQREDRVGLATGLFDVGLCATNTNTRISKGSLQPAEFFAKLIETFTHKLESKRKGTFEIDLRLRPFGNAGPVAVSIDAFESYFAPSGAAWPYERQALVKLRPIAGDADFGASISSLRDRLIYSGQKFDLAAMRAMRERQCRQLIKAGTLNAKLSPGTLVDCEYLVQALQITFGLEKPQLRETNTTAAMNALHAEWILSDSEHSLLHCAHRFFHRLINALRMVRGDAGDLTIPDVDSNEFIYLARRLGYGSDLTRLKTDLDQTAATVLTISRQVEQRLA